MGASILKHINVFITAATLLNNLVHIDFDIFNPTDAELRILFIQSDGKLDGTTFSHFEQHFDNFVIPPGQTVNSGRVDNVLLVQGALASLQIIPRAMLDVFNAATTQVGENGYTIPWLQLSQPSVPVTYSLDLGLANVGLPQLKSMALSMSASSVAATAKSEQSASSSGAVSASPSASPFVTASPAESSEGDATTPKSSESAQAEAAPSSEAKETPQATPVESASPTAKAEPTPSPTPTEEV